MRRLFQKLCPPRDEIAIYTTAVGLIALALVDPVFREQMAWFAKVIGVESTAEGFQTSRLKGIMHFYGGVMIIFTCIGSLAASLYLPLTRRRLDHFVEPVIVAHILIILASNILHFNKQQDVLSGVFAFASALYMFVFAIGYRFRLLTTLVSGRHASTRQAAIATISVIVLVGVLSLGAKLHWVHCYAIATGYAVGLASFFSATNANTEPTDDGSEIVLGRIYRSSTRSRDVR